MNGSDPVFPQREYTTMVELRGLTKREYFAVEFVKALVISAGCDNHSKSALVLADTLIAELSKEPQ